MRMREALTELRARGKPLAPVLPSSTGTGKWYALLLSLLAFGCNSDPTAKANASAPINTGFLTRTVAVNGRPHQFAVFLPYSYSTEMLWPTIVFLHGIGETGS